MVNLMVQLFIYENTWVNKTIWLLIFLLGNVFAGYPQELNKIYEINLDGISDASCDQYGFLYAANNSGDIFKYDLAGNILLNYSAKNVSPIFSLDVSKQSKIFGFYTSDQSYIILDRFFNILNESNFNSQIVGRATETTFSADNNIWLFDEMDFTLKKINLQNQELIYGIRLSLIVSEREWDIIQIVDYQNKLFVHNKNKSIYMLDNAGNLISDLGIKSDSKFSISGNKLYYSVSGRIQYIDIYTFEKGLGGIINNAQQIFKIIVQPGKLYVIEENKIEYFTF